MKYASLIFFSLILIWNGTFAQQGFFIKGKIYCQKKGISGVEVTDGFSVVETDKNGNFEFWVSKSADYVYYSLPSGYNSPIENGVPVFYKKLNQNLEKQTIDFELVKEIKSQQKHTFIAWADPQILELEEFELLDRVISDVKSTIEAIPTEIPVYGISLGDNVFDKLDFFEPYKKSVSKLQIPFYQVIGNHDLDYNERSDELSVKSFETAFGPTYFSFNIGKVHYVVLKDVFYYGYSYRYMGYITENQLIWLEKDLTKIEKGSTVILALHIPTVFGEDENSKNFDYLIANSVMNRKALFKILEPFNAHILAGHSHTQWNTILSPTLFEHVHAAASAAWWQGELCVDGSPKAYTVYEIDGDKVSWYFKGVGMDKNDQFKVYPLGADSENPDFFIANVFNFDPEWKVEWFENGILQGNMVQFWGKDPDANELYKNGSKKFWWLNAGQTNHLFQAKPLNKSAKITVQVTDRFGNKFTMDL